MERIAASSPGRICFAGEKLDWLVEGKGITCTLDKVSLRVVLEPTHANTVYVVSKTKEGDLIREEFDLPIYELGSSINYVKAVFLAFKQMGVDIREGVRINIESEIPQAQGLSSSAALCTALAGAIAKWRGLDLKRDYIAHIAYTAEKEILGIKCGQMDQYAIVFGGLCQIDSNTVPARVVQFGDKFKDYSILVVNPGIRRKTDSVNAEIQHRLENKDKSINRYITETTSIVEFLSALL